MPPKAWSATGLCGQRQVARGSPSGHMDTVLEAFITTWVTHFGMPACITTDRGTQFTSSIWGDWC